jgi:hypothetical protein
MGPFCSEKRSMISSSKTIWLGWVIVIGNDGAYLCGAPYDLAANLYLTAAGAAHDLWDIRNDLFTHFQTLCPAVYRPAHARRIDEPPDQ